VRDGQDAIADASSRPLISVVMVGHRNPAMRLAVRSGATRRVLIVCPIVFKFARDAAGKRCNRYEADLYRRVIPRRKAMLCPVIACSPKGLILMARAATPLTKAEHAEIYSKNGFPDWDYHPLDGDGECPFEFHKPDDWGWFDGKLVAVDYSAPAIADPNEVRRLIKNCLP
jgi:hypothetical protein